MLLITAITENPVLKALSENIQDCSGVFRFDDESGFFEALLFSEDGFEWVEIELCYRAGKAPAGKPEKEHKLGVVRSLKGDQNVD